MSKLCDIVLLFVNIMEFVILEERAKQLALHWKQGG